MQNRLEHIKALRFLHGTDGPKFDDPTPDDDPIEQVGSWWAAAQVAGLRLAEAMSLATATPEGRPSSRMVLLKGIDDRGLQFFTNYESRKAQQLDANPLAALTLHWASIERQIRIEGGVERLTREESFEYFRTRPRGSQIAAWVSDQSRPLVNRDLLEVRMQEMAERFGEEGEVPIPEHWGGYRVVPTMIEFWQGRESRLHDRWAFRRESVDTPWEMTRLWP